MHRSVLLAVARHPSLWGTALGFLREIGCKEWRKWLLCVLRPRRTYLRWRIATAYGDPDADLDPADVVAFLQWRRRQRER
ncbi:MAG TPA: hypothetical protein VLD62_04650 [Acidimicrobiia bacterium]|nr:hypothetical protein [Acidimicrobiia bacterium]